MPIHLTCPGCGKTLQIPDDHTGGRARCPACDTVFQVPGAAQPTLVPGDEPPDFGTGPTPNPYQPPSTVEQPDRAVYRQPHRGVLILVFGLLSWAVCPIFGLMAWIMGSADLREMRSGRMDPEGMGLTQAGSILGMICCLINVAVLLIYAVFLFGILGVAVMGH